MTKKIILKTMLLLCAFIAGSSIMWATTYKLTKVTSVSVGDKYVFERNSHVLNNSISSKALQTTATYFTTGLSGTETYVWTLESATDGYYLKNVSNSQFLNNSNSTDLSFGSKSSTWTFAFPDGAALISLSDKSRFLGESNTNTYKAYATSNLSTYGHDFTVYKLEETSVVNVTGVTLNNPSLSIVYGNIDSSLEATVAPADATNKAISWSSSNESVATVNSSGVVTALAVGTTTITVTTEDQAKIATCEVTVTPDMTKPDLVTEVFKETFGKVTGSAIANVELFDVSGWTLSGNVYASNGNGIRFSKSSSGEYATTPVINGLEGTATLTFKAAGWDTNEASIRLSGYHCILSPDLITELPSYNGYGTSLTEKAVTITVTGSDPKITFSTDANKRAYIDDIIITEPKNTIDIKLSSTGYASYCSLFALDLTPTEDYEAWAVTATSGDAVTFTKIPGKVPANTPFILYNSSKAGESVSVPVIDDDDAGIATVAGNMLRGTLSPTYVSTVNGDYTNFGLSGGNFLKIKDGVVKANKAYLPVLTSALPSDARLTIIFNDETTGVSEVRSKAEDVRAPYYDLQGRKVSQPRKGLYIVNGKKTLIK